MKEHLHSIFAKEDLAQCTEVLRKATFMVHYQALEGIDDQGYEAAFIYAGTDGAGMMSNCLPFNKPDHDLAASTPAGAQTRIQLFPSGEDFPRLQKTIRQSLTVVEECGCALPKQAGAV